MVFLAWTKLARLPDELRRLIYFGSAILTLIGMFSIRWNVVIGGQLFSKSLRGLTTYKMELLGIEGLLVALFFLVLPFIILYILVVLFPPWKEAEVKLEA
jgi:predicted membrane protein